MNYKKFVFHLLIFCFVISVSAQKTEIYTNNLVEYNKAIELYQNKSYLAAQELFNNLENEFDNSSELKANCAFYAANSAVRLGQRNSDNLMLEFVEKYPTSTKRNNAFIDVADYYFKTGKYAYASKWYAKVTPTNFSSKQEETFNFNYGYSLFSTKNFAKSKEYFLNILDSQEYGAQAKYYYGFIAYNQDDYDTADKYLGEVVNDAEYKSDVSYYLADMNFKLGKFEKALELGLPLLERAKRVEHSEISKIVGESYFNLKNYKEAIPHLKNYKGKRGKWNNTDFYLLGYSYFQQKDYENAVNNFNKIINGNNAVAQNAYYHLAECYLKLEEKTAALNAFKNASQMKFEPEIKKDAWLNYAKLSYEIGNPYKSVPEVLQEYIDLYPNSTHKKEINDLIISAYITSKDYEGALEFLKNKKSAKEKGLFQKVAFYYGVELFNESKFRPALESFENSLSEPIDKKTIALATFWKGETNYRLNNFVLAQADYNDFGANDEAVNTEEYEHLNYNKAYALFKQQEYARAADEFKKYASKPNAEEVRKKDSYLRIGDAYFVNSNYSNAINYYDRAISVKGKTENDYAQFQKAISYGLLGNESKKISELNSFLVNHLRGAYRDDAYYVLGNSHMKRNEIQQAHDNFDKLIANYNRSPLVSKTLLKKGLLYYNADQNQQAINTYKSIVKRFPNTPEALQAVQNTRQIYVDIGNVDEYANWVKTIDFVNVSNAELDNDMYESAEKQYLQNNHKKSITNFTKYLQKFPNGIHLLNANFYLAQSKYSKNNLNSAIPNYTFVVNQEQNEFTEVALSRLSQIYLENNNWEKAIPLLQRLEKEADNSQNITFAQSNLMKGFYAKKNYTKAENYAELVLNQPKIDARVQSDAHIIIARSAIETNNTEKARSTYKKVEQMASGELKAEALYYSAFFENADGSYRISNEIVQKIASDYATYKYWAAKSLIVMANNYYELKDAYQATYILESVIKNFAQFDDVVEKATADLSNIKSEQAKTNESIKN